MATTEPPRRIDEDVERIDEALDENVERIHEALVDLLEVRQPEAKAQPEYWQIGASDVEDGFATLVDEWRDLDPEFPARPSTQGTAASGTKKSPTSAS